MIQIRSNRPQEALDARGQILAKRKLVIEDQLEQVETAIDKHGLYCTFADNRDGRIVDVWKKAPHSPESERLVLTCLIESDFTSVRRSEGERNGVVIPVGR